MGFLVKISKIDKKAHKFVSLAENIPTKKATTNISKKKTTKKGTQIHHD